MICASGVGSREAMARGAGSHRARCARAPPTWLADAARGETLSGRCRIDEMIIGIQVRNAGALAFVRRSDAPSFPDPQLATRRPVTARACPGRGAARRIAPRLAGSTIPIPSRPGQRRTSPSIANWARRDATEPVGGQRRDHGRGPRLHPTQAVPWVRFHGCMCHRPCPRCRIRRHCRATRQNGWQAATLCGRCGSYDRA